MANRSLAACILCTASLLALCATPTSANEAGGPSASPNSVDQASDRRSQRMIHNDHVLCRVLRPQSEPPLADMISACDRSLNDPPLRNQQAWERQALILQSKAAWQYVAGQDAAALATLDSIDALASDRSSLVFDGSTGIAIMMLRALLYGESGRREEAVALLQRARNARPYALVVQQAIDLVEINITKDAERIPELTASHIALDPSAAQSLFYQHYRRGDLISALEFSEQVQFSRPQLLRGWSQSPRQTNLVAQITEELNFRYLVAYIRAAVGDQAGSERAFDAAVQRLAAHAGNDPQIGRRASRREIEAWQGRVRWVDTMRADVQPWRTAIALRARLLAGEPPDILDQPEHQDVISLEAAHDLARLVSTMHPHRNAATEWPPFRTHAESVARSMTSSRLNLVRLLPYGESLLDYPRFDDAADGFLADADDGYSQMTVSSGGPRTVRFSTLDGPIATADELTILAAATYAQNQQVDSFLLVGRQLLQRRIANAGPYGSIGGTVLDVSSPENISNFPGSGTEGSVLAVPIDSNSIPPEWEAHRSRLISVADVMASVGARQQAIEAEKAAQARQR